MTNSRHVYIYDDVEEKLKKEENVSALINRLLREHFAKNSIDTLTLEQKEKLLEIKRIELEAHKKIAEVQNV
jgi:hypothetical protein